MSDKPIANGDDKPRRRVVPNLYPDPIVIPEPTVDHEPCQNCNTRKPTDLRWSKDGLYRARLCRACWEQVER